MVYKLILKYAKITKGGVCIGLRLYEHAYELMCWHSKVPVSRKPVTHVQGIHVDCTVSRTFSWKGMPSQHQKGTNISWKSLDATEVCVSISSSSELLTAGTHFCLLMLSWLLPCRLSKTGWIPSGQSGHFCPDGIFFFFFLHTHAVASELWKLR